MPLAMSLATGGMILDQGMISIGTVAAIIGTAITATWWLGRRMDTLTGAIDRLLGRVEMLEAAQEKKVSRSEVEALALRRAILNPGHAEPDPRNPSQTIVVQAREIRTSDSRLRDEAPARSASG